MAVRLTDEQFRFLFPNKKALGGKPARNRFKRRAQDQPENQVEDQVVPWLRLRGWRVTRQQSGLFSRPFAPKARITIGEKGLPDYRCERPIIPAGSNATERTWPHELFYLEVKAPGEKPSATQRAWMDRCNACGTLAIWCDSLEMLERKYNRRFGRLAGDAPRSAEST